MSPASTPVRFLGSTAQLAKDVVLRSRGRYHVAGRGEPPWIVVADPDDADRTTQSRSEFPDSQLVLWDRRDDVDEAVVEAALNIGADAFVIGSRIDVLIAHLDALRRRHTPRSLQ